MAREVFNSEARDSCHACENAPVPSTGIAGKKSDFALLRFGEMTCKERLSKRGAGTTHYGKICSLVTSSDKSGSWHTGTLGAEHGAPGTHTHREICPSLSSLASEFVIVMILLLKILTK